MADKVFVKPGLGADGQPFVTPNPATGQPLKLEGEWVERDRMTRRRLREGDWVEAGTAPSPAAERTSKP